MAYSFEKPLSHHVVDGNVYFFDSNIWLKILQPKINPSYRDNQYRLLFQKILANNKAKIAVSTLVLSEVINRILRDVYMKKLIDKIKKNDPCFILSNDFYKTKFRPSQEFRIAYNLICDEIKNYHTSINQISDDFGNKICFRHILSDPPQGLDFNDHYYYKLCKLNKYILVTDDKDFWVDDVQVITMSDTLYNKHIKVLIQNKQN